MPHARHGKFTLFTFALIVAAVGLMCMVLNAIALSSSNSSISMAGDVLHRVGLFCFLTGCGVVLLAVRLKKRSQTRLEPAQPKIPLTSRPVDSPARGFPLLGLFVLTAICAAVTALVTPVVQATAKGDVALTDYVVATSVCAIASALLGMLIGALGRNPLSGVGLGALTGFITGAVIGPIALAPLTKIGQLVSTSAVGSLLLLLVGAFAAVSRKGT